MLLFITLLFHCLIKQSEGFSNPPRATNNPAWAKLSDDQVLELLAIRLGALYSTMIIDEAIDKDAAKTVKDIAAALPPETQEVKNQSDIKALKNIVMNKAAENKNISVAFSVLQSHLKEGLKLNKRQYEAQQKNDRNLQEAVFEDAKALAKKGIRDIKEKIPNFPFNPQLKKGFPEGFVEVTKPTASECKRFFKCSSIYAA
jgi:replicative DNA helicase